MFVETYQRQRVVSSDLFATSNYLYLNITHMSFWKQAI